MAAPNYVPVKTGQPRFYESPPRRAGSWRAERPGDLGYAQPQGPGFGRQGPDQGYAYKLVNAYADKVHLVGTERWADAAHGCVLIALKRASMFGRAPVSFDLEIAFRLWGFLDEEAPEDLVALRSGVFDHIENPHHYREAGLVADAVSDAVLAQPPDQVERRYRVDWRDQLVLDALDGGHDDLDGPADPADAQG